MVQLRVIFLIVASICIQASMQDKVASKFHRFFLEEQKTKQAEPIQNATAIPIIVESNLPSNMNNVAMNLAQNAIDSSSNAIQAADNIKTNMINSYGTLWNVAINPVAFYVNGYYFAHYIVNNSYHVIIYNVNCPY